MAYIVDRRSFLKVSFAAGFAVHLSAAEPAPANWALISDIHCPEDSKDVYRGFYPYANLQKTAPEVAASPAQICAVCGDLARLTGNPGDYEALKALLRPVLDKMPVGFTLGNHDSRENFEKAFATPSGTRQAVSGKHVIAMEWTDLRAVFLDSLLATNITPGQLGSAQRQWLTRYLGADHRSAFVFLHHDFGDSDGALTDTPRFLESIAPLKQVKAVFYGHSHEYKFGTHQGIHLINVPSVAYNFRDSEPVGWMLMTRSALGATLALRAHGGNTSFDGATKVLKWR